MKLLSRVERNQRNIRPALPDATIRSKTHSNNSWSEPKASSHAVHRMVKRAPSVSRFLGIREYPWFIDAQRASCIFVVQKYTRVVVVFYRFTDSIARRSHKSTFRDRYPVIDATCVHRDFNDEGKRCVASLRAGFTSPTMYACDESNVCRCLLGLMICGEPRYARFVVGRLNYWKYYPMPRLFIFFFFLILWYFSIEPWITTSRY